MLQFGIRRGLEEITVMETLREYLPFLVPLVIIQLALMVLALVHALRHNNYKRGSREVWVLIILLFQIVGPLAYFILGRDENS